MIAEVWGRLRRDSRARIGLIVVAMLLLLALLAPLLARHDPIRVDLLRQLQPPSVEHWMGTDVQGRDVWARLVYGARISLAVGLISQSIALAIGVTFGLIAGYYGRWIDDLVMRLADVTLAFPTLLLLIAMVAALQPQAHPSVPSLGSLGVNDVAVESFGITAKGDDLWDVCNGHPTYPSNWNEVNPHVRKQFDSTWRLETLPGPDDLDIHTVVFEIGRAHV